MHQGSPTQSACGSALCIYPELAGPVFQPRRACVPCSPCSFFGHAMFVSAAQEGVANLLGHLFPSQLHHLFVHKVFRVVLFLQHG